MTYFLRFQANITQQCSSNNWVCKHALRLKPLSCVWYLLTKSFDLLLFYIPMIHIEQSDPYEQ